MKTKKAYNAIDWTTEMISFLKINHLKMNNKQLANGLGLKLTATRTKLYELGLFRMELEYWTEEQTLFLRENYKVIGDVELAEIYNSAYYKKKGWTNKHIEKKRRYLKLKRTDVEKEKIKERNVDQGRFSVNHWKRWFEAKAKPGTIRIWTTQDGYPYKVIKVPEGFIHYAPFCFESYFGPVPKGYIVSFLDSNQMNVFIENLTLITREEHARKNTGSAILSDNYVIGMLSHKHPEIRKELAKHPELIELKRKQLLLNRKINKQQDEQGKNK